MKINQLENILKAYKAKVKTAEYAFSEICVRDNGKEAYITFYPPSRGSYEFCAYPRNKWKEVPDNFFSTASIPAYGYRLLELRIGALYTFLHTRKNLQLSLKEDSVNLLVGWACKKIDELAILTNRCLPLIEIILNPEGVFNESNDSIERKMALLKDEVAKATKYSKIYFGKTRLLSSKEEKEAIKALNKICLVGSRLYRELKDMRL